MSDLREVERRFLVDAEGWRRKAGKPAKIVQGYLARGRKAITRVRIKNDRIATLTIKSRERGIERSEFEYRIPLKHARLLLALCGTDRIEKHRYELPQGKRKWEIDVFGPPHDGLGMAEIELEHPDEVVSLPRWLGREVTNDPAYRNSSLALAGRP